MSRQRHLGGGNKKKGATEVEIGYSCRTIDPQGTGEMEDKLRIFPFDEQTTRIYRVLRGCRK